MGRCLSLGNGCAAGFLSWEDVPGAKGLFTPYDTLYGGWSFTPVLRRVITTLCLPHGSDNGPYINVL